MSWAKGDADDLDLNIGSRAFSNGFKQGSQSRPGDEDIDCFADVAGSFIFKSSAFKHASQNGPALLNNKPLELGEDDIQITSTELKPKHRTITESKREWLKHKDVVRPSFFMLYSIIYYYYNCF